MPPITSKNVLKPEFENVGSRKNDIYTTLILGLIVFSVYALFPTKTFYWDGLIFAEFIESSQGFGAHLLHPNHLIYNFFGYAAYGLARFFNPEIRALFVLQALTIFFGALCAAVFFLIVKKIFGSLYFSAAMTMIFAFSAGWWRYATDADVYIVSIFFLLIGFLFVLPNEKPRPLAVALAHTTAMLFHQLAVLFFPVAVIGIYLQTVGNERKERLKIVTEYAATAFLLTFTIYCLSFYWQSGGFDPKEFVKWMVSFAPVAGVQREFSDIVRHNYRALYKIFVDGSSKLLQPGILTYALLAVLAGSVILLITKSAANWREIKFLLKYIVREKVFDRSVIVLCLVWIIPYLIFLIFFSPENLFYRLFYFPAMVILIAAIFSEPVRKLETRRWRLALFALSFGLYNFLFYIQPNSVIRKETQTSAAVNAKNIWTGKTVVFYDRTVPENTNESNDRLFRYFNPTVAWKPLDFVTLKEFESRIAELKNDGSSVWLDASAIKKLSTDVQMTDWLAGHTIENADLSAPKYDIKFVEINR